MNVEEGDISCKEIGEVCFTILGRELIIIICKEEKGC